MSDRYSTLIRTPVGQLLAKNLGLPNPVPLERWTEGAPLVDGTVVLGGAGRLEKSLVAALDDLGVAHLTGAGPVAEGEQKYKGLVFDATGITASDQLVTLQEFFTPVMRSLGTCPRVVVIGTPPETVHGAERVAQRALEGFTRSLGKEIGRGGTVQLVYVAPESHDHPAAIASTLAFLLSPKSAYVSGQVVRIGCHGATDAAAEVDWATPLTGKVDVVVHNAGITRDKKLANMKRDGFSSVIAVNLTAPERITTELLRQKLVASNGRIVGVASIAGIAGNVGQTNYAASKAGVIGLVDSLADDLEDGITINAVAPGFIETKMTAAVPFATREVGRRLNAMSQGGRPVDVAEAIAWYANPASTAVNGNVVRVCGQMMLGA